MKSLVFVTGNSYKFEIARKALESAGIEITQEKLDTPEIQSTEVMEVAAYSARWAANKLGKPVVTSDAGYYIEALKGFPGPFVKYVNNWFSAEDFIRLMDDKSNRKAKIVIGIAYCEPGKDPVTFSTEALGSIALQAGEKISNNYPIDQVFIPDGFDKVFSELPKEATVKYWMNKESYWEKLAEYLINKVNT